MERISYQGIGKPPYLSVVVTSRNDNHGRNMLHRMEVFVQGLACQCERYGLDAELIVVEWNPIHDQKRLHDCIAWPRRNDRLAIRFIEAPAHIHNQIENSDKIPLFQMIAKNVGIRRARGDFILAAGIDLLFSNELIWALSKKVLDPACFYRVARYDVGCTQIPTDISLDQQLAFCEHHLVRVHAMERTIEVKGRVSPPAKSRPSFYQQSFKDLTTLSRQSHTSKLFTNACGDFTLMAREQWLNLRGYPQVPKWSIFLDGVLLHMAHVSGLRQVVLQDPMRIYHIEHDIGWAVDQDTVKHRPSLDYNKDYLPWISRMRTEKRVITPNDTDWGYANVVFKETAIGAPIVKNAPAARFMAPDAYDRTIKTRFRTWIERIARAEKRLYYRDQTVETLQQLVSIAQNHKPTRIVEIGTLSGLSLRAWQASGVRASITAIDLSFAALEESKKNVPLAMDNVQLIEQDVRNVDFKGLWKERDHVLLFIDAHDQPFAPIMEHLLNTVIARLPSGSLVVVDDCWFSPQTLDAANAELYFKKNILNRIDELQCFDGYHAPYWKGGSFFGFHEVWPLMAYINRHKVALSFDPEGKTIWFQAQSPQPDSVREDAVLGGNDERWGRVVHHPLGWLEKPDASAPALDERCARLCAQAVSSYSEGGLKEAFAAFTELIRQNSSFAGAYYGLAVILARTGEFYKALSLLEKTLIINCDRDEVRRLRDDLQNKVGALSGPKAPGPFKVPAEQRVTLFTAPKPFTGPIDIIQRNAIKSWTLLNPRPEILLLGDEKGVAEAARELGVTHLPQITVNKQGTPLLDAIFETAQSHAVGRIMAYVNTDIILLQDFIPALSKLTHELREGFLAVGRRWNLAVTKPVDFQNPLWDRMLIEQIKQNGHLHAATGIDYFLFNKGSLGVIKPFALGRTAWDNWLIRHAMDMGLSVVDTTDCITAIHQNHDYRHLKGGKEEAWKGLEARQNLALAGGYDNLRDISHARLRLTPRGVVPNRPDPHAAGQPMTPASPLKDDPRFSIIMIVLNGMPFIEAALGAVYDIAHEIIIVEGAVERCLFSATPDGRSTDGTVAFIERFPDPQTKIRLIQGRWPEKLQMQNEALSYVTGDYVWLVDSDEVYRKQDIEKIVSLVKHDPGITQINFICHNFWKSLDHIFVSKKLFMPEFHIRRVFKYQTGARFISHRPPTMVYPGSIQTTEQRRCVDGLTLFRQGVAIYHYSYVLDEQVRQKIELYRRYGWEKNWNIDMQRWYEEFFRRWTPGTSRSLERRHPIWTGDKASYSVPFKGKHPEAIARLLSRHPGMTRPLFTGFAMRHVVDAIETLRFRYFMETRLVALETGTIRSYHEKHESTRHISNALGRQGRLISIDINPESIRISKEICKHADNVDWALSDSVTFLKEHCPETLHFVLLDSVNDPDIIFTEFALVAPHLAPNGIVIVDDAGIRADGGGPDGAKARKGLRVWSFLKQNSIGFEILETVAGHGAQIKVTFTPDNRNRIIAALACQKDGIKNRATLHAETVRQDRPQTNRPRADFDSRGVSSQEPRRHMVIDGVIFQLQAGGAMGISRVWQNLLTRLGAHLSDFKITMLERRGFPAPVQGFDILRIPAYDMASPKGLEKDEETLNEICRRIRADVFISTYYTRAPGIKNLLMIHDLIPELMGLDQRQPEWRAKRDAIETADAFVAVSDNTRKDLLRFYPQTRLRSVAVAPNGIEKTFRPANPSEIEAFRERHGIREPYILIVGNRHWYKNADRALLHLSQTTGAKHNAVLCVGGERKLSHMEQQASGRLKIYRIGRLSDSDLATAYSGARALLYPSQYEGFGLPLLEAMACGCPVIASRHGAIGEVGGDAIAFCDMDHPQTIQDAINTVEDTAVRQVLIKKGFERCARFDWGRSSILFAEQIKALADDASPVVSAIVSTYNAERFMKGCLDDLVSQTIADQIEIIVVDSASQQNEKAIVQAFQQTFPRLKYLRTSQRESVYRAWNRGINFAKGRYVTNANTDDRHCRDAFERMVRLLDARADVALVYADVIKTTTANQTFADCTPSGVLNWPQWDRRILLEKGCFIGPQPMWRKCVHDFFGGFDESLTVSADYEFWLRISQIFDFQKLERPSGLYHERADSIEHRERQTKKSDDQTVFQRYAKAAKQTVLVKFQPLENLRRAIQAGDQKAAEDHLAVIADLERHIAGPMGRAVRGLCDDMRSALTGGGSEKTNIFELFEKKLSRLFLKRPKGDQTMSTYLNQKRIEPSDSLNEKQINQPDLRIQGGSSMNNSTQIHQAIRFLFNNGHAAVVPWVLDRLIESYPDYAPAHYDRAMLAHESDEQETALRHFRIAAQLAPSHAGYQKALADYLHVGRQDMAGAVTQYRKVIALEPANQEVMLILAHLLTALRQLDEARDCYAKVLALDPGDKEARQCLDKLSSAVVSSNNAESVEHILEKVEKRIQGGDTRAAAALLEKALRQSPGNARIHNDLGVLMYENGDMDQARRFYEKATELAPEEIVFQKNLADFYYVEKGDVHQALKGYVRALTLDPQDVEVLITTGHICMALGKHEDARVFLRRVLEIEPWSQDAQALLARMDAQAGKNNTPPTNLYLKAQSLAASGDRPGAVTALEELIAREPDNALAFNDLGVLYYEQGNRQGALGCYEQAARLEPGNAVCRKNLADFYCVEMGKTQEALKIYVDLLTENPRDVDCLDAAGTICLSIGNHEDARVFFQRIVEIDPNHQKARELMGHLS